MIIGLLTSVPFILAMMFVIKDMDAVRTAALPSLEAFHQATGSKATAIALQSILTVVFYSKCTQYSDSQILIWPFFSMHAEPVDHLRPPDMGIFSRRWFHPPISPHSSLTSIYRTVCLIHTTGTRSTPHMSFLFAQLCSPSLFASFTACCTWRALKLSTRSSSRLYLL